MHVNDKNFSLNKLDLLKKKLITYESIHPVVLKR